MPLTAREFSLLVSQRTHATAEEAVYLVHTSNLALNEVTEGQLMVCLESVPGRGCGHFTQLTFTGNCSVQVCDGDARDFISHVDLDEFTRANEADCAFHFFVPMVGSEGKLAYENNYSCTAYDLPGAGGESEECG